jgi:hypothetical protein
MRIKAMKLSVHPVTVRACARPAPGRPAAYSRRWAVCPSENQVLGLFKVTRSSTTLKRIHSHRAVFSERLAQPPCGGFATGRTRSRTLHRELRRDHPCSSRGFRVRSLPALRKESHERSTAQLRVEPVGLSGHAPCWWRLRPTSPQWAGSKARARPARRLTPSDLRASRRGLRGAHARKSRVERQSHGDGRLWGSQGGGEAESGP